MLRKMRVRVREIVTASSEDEGDEERLPIIHALVDEEFIVDVIEKICDHVRAVSASACL